MQVFCVHLLTWLKIVMGFKLSFAFIISFVEILTVRSLIGLILIRYRVLEMSHVHVLQFWDFHGT